MCLSENVYLMVPGVRVCHVAAVSLVGVRLGPSVTCHVVDAVPPLRDFPYSTSAGHFS